MSLHQNRPQLDVNARPTRFHRSKLSRNAVPSTVVSQGTSLGSTVLVSDLSDVVTGFVDHGGLLAIPIVGAFLLVGLIAGFIFWSAQPSVRDDEDD